MNKQDENYIKKHHEWLSSILSRRIQECLEALPFSQQKEIDAEVIKELQSWKVKIDRIKDPNQQKKETWV